MVARSAVKPDKRSDNRVMVAGSSRRFRRARYWSYVESDVMSDRVMLSCLHRQILFRVTA
jgi:hypothetical protein